MAGHGHGARAARFARVEGEEIKRGPHRPRSIFYVEKFD